jgi:beta-1,4-mannosyl-glycoprotein beta-1,4-N-acetylglucosaminyltransferase
MALYDVFPFYNELDILEIRLNTLDPVVDFFVITEATTSFAGNQKKLYLKDNLSYFREFENKILLQTIDNVPKLTAFERDWYQRDQAKDLLITILKDSDFLLYGDVDEIPKLEAVKSALTLINNEIKIAHFAQDLNYYYLNLTETSGTLLSYMGEYPEIKEKKWLGTTLSQWDYAKKFSMTALRNPEHKLNGVRIDNGGWHFSYVGGEPGISIQERALNKIQNNSHQELNSKKILSKVEKNTMRHKDVFGRKGANFQVNSDRSYLPDYVIDNLAKFEKLITE